MAKRSTDTEIIDQAWFQDMSPESKLIWWYLEKKCDSAGIYKIDVITMKRQLGCEINIDKFIDEVNRDYDKLTGEPIEKCRVMVINEGRKLWVTGYIAFQWGNSNNEVSEAVNVVQSGLRRLKEHGLYDIAINEGFIRVLKGSKGYIKVIEGSEPLETYTYTKTIAEIEEKTEKKDVKEKKRKYGEHKNVLLSEKEFKKLEDEFGKKLVLSAIDILSEGIAIKGYKYKNHYLVLRKWPLEEARKRDGPYISKSQKAIEEYNRIYEKDL